MKKYLSILFLIVLVSGCGHTDEPTPVVPVEPVTPAVPEVDKPMTFAPLQSAVSRTGTPMQGVYKLFKVWTYKHTQSSTTETVMPGYQVKYLDDASLWQYDGTIYTSHTEIANQYLKYWDSSAQSYDFVAYAPVDVPDVTIDYTSEGFTIKGIEAHNSSVPDIVVANHLRELGTLHDVDVLTGEELDVQPQVYHDVVPLRFHHLLSKVEYRIYNTGSKTAEISNIVVNYDSGETLNIAGDYAAGIWTNITSTSNNLLRMTYVAPNLLELVPITQDNYKTHSHRLATYYEIPQTLNRYLNVSVDVDGQVVSNRFDLGDAAWKYDTNYVYYIHIAAGEGDTSPILIGLTADDFLADDPIDETQTNW